MDRAMENRHLGDWADVEPRPSPMDEMPTYQELAE